MTTATEKSRIVLRPRFSRKPVAKRDVPVVHVTQKDIKDWFGLLCDVKFVPLDYGHALLGGDYQSFSKHNTRLFLNGYIDFPPAQSRSHNANYNYRIASLAKKGADLRSTKGYPVPPIQRFKNFEHKLLGNVFELSSRIALKENPDLEIIKWAELVTSDKMPEATREHHRPEEIPVRNHVIIPDDKPAVISYGGKSFRFFVREDDCDTESSWSDFQNSIKFKAWAYLTILKDEIYTDHFGAETFTVLFHTISADRAAQILRTVEMVIVEYGFDAELAMNIAVKHTPIFSTLDERPAPATGHVLTEPWKRILDFPDLYLNQP